MGNLKLGATLFCYGTEYARYQYDFEECVKQAYLAGAEGYEIVGTQMIPSYPNVSDDFLGLIQRLKAKYGIGPVGYGANNDKGMMHDRNLSDNEMLADAVIDLKAAHKLGCKVMRVQYMLSPAAFEKLAFYAELFDIKVGIEIHNPESPASPLMQDYLEVIKKTGSKHLGFIPDFGCFAIAPNKPHWMKALKAGVEESHLELAANLRRQGVPFKSKDELPKMLEELKTILPYCFEFHGKFHYLDEDLVEPSIPYAEILSIIKNSDFDGYLISEYEDELYCGGTEFTRRQLQMTKQLLGKE